MKMFSKKTRLAGAVLLTAGMVLAGTAWGDTINSNTHWNSSGYTATPGESLAIKDGAIVTVDDSATITVDEDFEIYYGSVTLGNSTITTNNGGSPGDGYGFNIGWYDNGDDPVPSQGPASLIVSAGKTAILNADGFISIKKDGALRLGNDATANITLNSSGVFLLGAPKGLTAYSEFDTFSQNWNDGPVDLVAEGNSASNRGGLFQLGAGSTATISGRAVFGDVGNGGGLKLGKNSTLNITGNAYFLNGSSYELDLADPASTGKISVTGKATIEKGARSHIIDSGTLADIEELIDNQKIILTAGSFADDTVFSDAYYTFDIVGHDLRIVGGVDTPGAIANITGSAPTTNYRNAGQLIDSLPDALRNDLRNIVRQIDGIPNAEVALKQMLGEEALAANSAVHSTMTQSNQTMAGRFQAIRGNSSPAAGAGDNLNRLWLGGFGQWSSQDNDNDVYGYDYNSVGVMLGYDHEVEALSGLTVGLSGSWSSGTVENNDGRAETDIDSFGLGVYGTYEFAGGFFMDADLGYGRAKNDASIDLVVGGKKTGDFDVTSFQAGLNFGYDFQLSEATTLTPSLGLRYTHIKQDGWREKIVSDPNNMAVANWFDDSTQNFLEIPVNLRLATEIQTQGGAVISPELRVGAVFTAGDPESSLRMGFVGSNDSVTIYGIEPGRSRFVAGAGIKAQLNDTLDIFAGYDLEGRRGYTGHSASLGLGFSF